MRKIRKSLRLKYAAGLSQRQIAASVGSALSTIQECLRRAAQASLSWPLPDELDDAQLEASLYPVRPPVAAIPAPHAAVILVFPFRPPSLQGTMQLKRGVSWRERLRAYP
jgi:hypothetical protein